jgi:SAM-dependent methyltransferase
MRPAGVAEPRHGDMTRVGDESRGSVWDRFWSAKTDLAEVYGTDGRVVEALEELGSWSGKTILEVGCGSGRDGIEMARRGAHAVLFDLSMPALLAARGAARKAGVAVSQVLGDTLALPYRTRSLDCVYHQGLLEDGGVLLVDVPQTFHPYTLLKKTAMLLRVWFAGWETQFTPRQLRSLLVAAGLDVVSVYGRWFKPSLSYRVFRQGLARVLGLRLPLYPRGPRLLARPRDWIARRLRRTPLGPWTAANLGAIARKPAGVQGVTLDQAG